MLIIGHRGARGLAPENTLQSLQKGLEHGVDMLEFDVRVTRDHVPVLHHDASIAHSDGGKLRIQDHNFKELVEHVPHLVTLETVLTSLEPTIVLYIEVKPGEDVVPIVSVLKKQLGKRWPADKILLASKSQTTLMELHRRLPNLDTIVIEPWSGMRAGRRAAQLGTKRIAMNQRWLWRGFITPVTRRGWQLYAYTLNDPKKASRWQRYGLAGVITDFPDRFEK